ncbi:MAG: MlaD family protein [Saprospiraceae bacterium]|nr:MlaD family protein [Saprospiraceae bacterium]
MLKINNETKIGILALVALALGIWGFQFLKGINILKTSKTFYVKYANVDQLRPSSPIFINGLEVGTVKDMYVDPEDDKTIIAVLNIEQPVDIPKETKATIIGLSLMGGKAIELEIPYPCKGRDCARSGDFLEGRTKSFLESMIGKPEEIDAYTSRLQLGLTSVYDSIANPDNPQGFGRTLVALDQSLQNIAELTRKINRLLDVSTASFAATAENAAEITRTLRDNKQNINDMMANLAAVSEQLNKARFDVTADKAGAAIDSLRQSLSDLRATLAATQYAMVQVDTLAQRLVAGEGTAGKMLADEELYNNLVRTTRQTQLLMQDLRLNPKRYTTVKVKVFGKNKTPEYDVPFDDPAYYLLVDSLERAYSEKVKNQ